MAFEALDLERGEIRPAAAWFASEDARRAFAPLLVRPYDPRRGGVTEAAVEHGGALLIPQVEAWPGATALRERLADRLDGEHAARTWEWYRSGSFIACPVRTAGGRTLGVLVISSHPPHPPLDRRHLRAVAAFAGLAALALERSELLERESSRAQEERLLNQAWQVVSATLEPEAAYRAIVEQAVALTGADRAEFWRYDAAAGRLLRVAGSGGRDRVLLGEGPVGRAAESGEPVVDAGAVHVPVALGGRLFGVVSAHGRFGESELRRLRGLALGAAGAIANALDFQREHVIVNALTRGYVPEPLEVHTGFEIGLVYEPVGHDVGGGDLFGIWRRPDGTLAVLLGDVCGKGLEVAALSSMVRFFVEARAWDTHKTAEVLAQTNRILRRRLPAGGFATAFLAVIDDGALRFCNAGHPPPRILRAAGGEDELANSGPPLGVDDASRYAERVVAFAAGDTLFAATDGLTEARRDKRFFGDARLPALLAEHGRTLAAQPLAELVHRDAAGWAARRHDDIVVLVVRRSPAVEVRRERADGPAAQALFADYMALVRARLGADFEPDEAIFATEASFAQPGAAFVVLYVDGRPVGCGGVRPLGPGVAEIKRMFVPADARGRGHGRSLLCELEALAAAAGARRVRLLTTDALFEGRRLYESAGYREAEAWQVDGRRDAWLEKELPLS